ncbi:MAG: RelA/SpoT domain-containing protein [Tissierellales bacterium]|jgi:ppGpp synthetase/RelA/SpoT-type nucleotidyltranferase|nr:RelA/SpoT domain-containing protein [Tissierellales bacterium]
MKLIDAFIQKYTRNIELYQKASKYCAQVCEKELSRSGVRAIVSYRAKSPSKLREKILKRSSFQTYASIEDIRDDIVDLAGVRIALYFPGDQVEIEKILKKNFDIIDIRKFPRKDSSSKSKPQVPYHKMFSGYRATHYRMRFNNKKLPDKKNDYKQIILEVQVASVLMHAWAEVEHDLVYKPLNGTVSKAEYEILDELNGLVLSGEIALSRLQTAYKDRITRDQPYFSNHYELAAFLYDKLSNSYNFNPETLVMGRADRLFKFLKSTNLNSPAQLSPYLVKLHLNTQDSTVVQQITDLILFDDPSLYAAYVQVKLETLSHNPYSNSYMINASHIDSIHLNELINVLIDLEIRHKIFTRNNDDILPESQSVEHELFNYLDYIKNIRNKLIHRKHLPSDEDIHYALIAANKLSDYLNQ